jgi:cephalosporin hydroxylase
MTPFTREVDERIAANAQNAALKSAAHAFLRESTAPKYSYNFSWLGRPVIQYPQDIVAVQELIWKVRPDLVIETGIAHGGSLVLTASILALLDLCDAQEAGVALDPGASVRKVIGIDIDIRAHNRAALDAHPMRTRMELIEGSSIEPAIAEGVALRAREASRVMVFLDSNHTHDHVLRELELYAPLTSVGSYCVVFDTLIEDLNADMYPDRPWGPGNSPKSAIREYLASHSEFEVDTAMSDKLLISVANGGFLKRTA